MTDSRDLWRHRSLTMRCDTCMWFLLKGRELGRCRRHAPTLSGWPAVFRKDWCGDHKLDEQTHDVVEAIKEGVSQAFDFHKKVQEAAERAAGEDGRSDG